MRPNGSKLWQLRYRHHGKKKAASLGWNAPDVSLSDAREKRDSLRKVIASGSDPVAVKRAERAAKQAAAVNTFEIVAREWHTHWKPAAANSMPAR